VSVVKHVIYFGTEGVHWKTFTENEN
jgi:hypothetical protein